MALTEQEKQALSQAVRNGVIEGLNEIASNLKDITKDEAVRIAICRALLENE